MPTVLLNCNTKSDECRRCVDIETRVGCNAQSQLSWKYPTLSCSGEQVRIRLKQDIKKCIWTQSEAICKLTESMTCTSKLIHFRSCWVHAHSGWKLKFIIVCSWETNSQTVPLYYLRSIDMVFLHSQTKLMLCWWPLVTIVPRLLFLTYSIKHYKNI